MFSRLLPLLAAALLALSACTQTDTNDYTAPERGDPEYLKGKNTRADQLYVSTDTEAGGRDFRNVYIAPADLSKLLIIQPEGVEADQGWQLSDIENSNLQQAINREFTATLGFESAYNIVPTREQAEIIVHTTLVAIHPNATRAQVEAGAREGGAITASIALVNASSGTVMVRSVDTKSSEQIWAFHQVGNNDPAVNLIFRSWGNSIRRGMLQLQGRSSDPLSTPVLLQEQK
jgi:hypothetical protein